MYVCMVCIPWCVSVCKSVWHVPQVFVYLCLYLYRKGASWVVGTLVCACNCHVIPGVCVYMEGRHVCRGVCQSVQCFPCVHEAVFYCTWHVPYTCACIYSPRS